MSGLVGNPEDRFSRVEAQIKVVYLLSILYLGLIHLSFINGLRVVSYTEN